jgi:hypothetical protein
MGSFWLGFFIAVYTLALLALRVVTTFKIGFYAEISQRLIFFTLSAAFHNVQ